MTVLAAAYRNYAIVAVAALARELFRFLENAQEHFMPLIPIDLDQFAAFVISAPAAHSVIIKDDRRLRVGGVKTTGTIFHDLTTRSG